MILHILRALFVLLMAAVGWTFVLDPDQPLGGYTWTCIAIALVLGVLIICADILAPRRKLMVFSCVFTGLIVGVVISYALSFAVTLLVDFTISYLNSISLIPATVVQRDAMIRLINLMVFVISCYLSISFVLQTGNDFRFIIPYVEFSRQTKGARPILLDTNILIDGRIAEIMDTGVIDNDLIVPQFVVKELRTLADSADRLKRNRGKHGQEILQRLKENPKITCKIQDFHGRGDLDSEDVDERLLILARTLNAKVMTTDNPLAQEARVKNVDVINLNDLAMKLKAAAMPGDRITLSVSKPGESAGQGVGYLTDGTMVVIEDGRTAIGEDVEVVVTNVRQNVNGKMLFARLAEPRPQQTHPRREKPSAQAPAA